MIRVTVWNEFRHEKSEDRVKAVYPEGIHKAIADFLGKEEDFVVRTATLDEPENGLPQEVLDDTDVLIWWGHMAHNEVKDEVAERVCKRVLDGMGFLPIHSGHASKPFSKLMGTNTYDLRWHEDGDMARVWVIDYAHPIAAGLGDYFDLPVEETYGEHFGIPQPEDLVFMNWYPTGEVFRSGCCWHRGQGRIFYFQPGHETYPTYYNPNVQKVIINAVRWAYNPNPRPITVGWTRAI